MYMKNIALTVLMVFLGLSPAAVFAQDGSSTNVRFEERKESGKPTLKAALDASAIACIKAAVVKREDALISGFDIYAAALRSARQIRRDALSAAWDKTVPSERRAAVKAADRAFTEATKVARNTWNTSRRTVWKTFETDKKACRVTVTSSDTGSSVTDASI